MARYGPAEDEDESMQSDTEAPGAQRNTRHVQGAGATDAVDVNTTQQSPSQEILDANHDGDDTFAQQRSRKKASRQLGESDPRNRTHQRPPTERIPIHSLASYDIEQGQISSSDGMDDTLITIPDESQSERMSVVSEGDYDESLHDSEPYADGVEEHDALSWPEQLYNLLPRQRILATRSAVHHGPDEVKHIRYTPADLHQDLFGKPSGTGSDRAQMGRRGRAFRWGHDNTFSCSAVDGDTVRIATICGAGEREKYQSKLDIFMAHAQVSAMQAHAAPSATLRSIIKAQALADVSTPSTATTWLLSSSLFDDLNLPESALTMQARASLTRRIRKEAFGQWLKTSSADETRKDQTSASTVAERILLLLLGNQISQACTLAASTGNLHLATLLTVGSGDSSMRADIQKQIASWQADKTLSSIDPALQSIYQLLGGNVTNLLKSLVAIGETGSFRIIIQGLDWRRALGLCLWHGVSNEADLDSVLDLYETAWRKQPAESALTGPINVNGHLDCRYKLLRIFGGHEVQLQSFADPGAWEQASFDVVEGWLMVQYLVSKNAVNWNDAEMDALTAASSAQLESSGQVENALFVALFTKSPTARRVQVMRLLTRLASKLEASAEARLQTEMQIPREWFFEAKALRARHEQRFCDEAHFLLLAGLSIDAHETLVRHVGPDCIISGDLEPLAKVLRAFTSVDNIPNWSFGGRVYQNAIALVEGQNTAGSHAFAKEIVKTLPSMSTSSFKQKVAINEIGSMCLQVLPSAENLRPKFKLASHGAFSVKAHSALHAFRSLAA